MVSDGPERRARMARRPSGVITDDLLKRGAATVAARNVAGGRPHDHLCWLDTTSGTYIER